MKITTHGALPAFSTIMLSALVCVACNSEPEPESALESEPLIEAAMPGNAEFANSDACTPEFPGVEVDISALGSSNGLLNTFGGPCKISNTVIASAAEIHRNFLADRYCSVAKETAAVIGQGDMGVALKSLELLIAQGQYTETESEELRPALLLCGDESVMRAAVEDFLKSADLTVYSIGTAEYEDTNCPAIVWSLSNYQQGQIYNVAGLAQCTGIGIPHAQLFNPEQNPDAQLPGDYLRDVLAYNGELPSHFVYKDAPYRFVSEESLVQDEDGKTDRIGADRSILGDDALRYIYWSTGENNVENEYLATDELLTLQYHDEEFKDMPLSERALAALQRSYGAPMIGEGRDAEPGARPAVYVTVTSSSGDQFVMIVESANGMSKTQLIDWLPNAQVELLVVHDMDSEREENLTLEGALFSDGINTVYGQLEDCKCSEQGILGWLGEGAFNANRELEQMRKDFIARVRNTEVFRDWTVTSELGPRAVSYVLSSYDNSSRNNDAAFVAHHGGATHTLYVAMDLACNNESLLLEIDERAFNVPASCRNVHDGGVAYTLLDSSVELKEAMLKGAGMDIGLVKPGAETFHEEYQFSLMGATRAMNGLDADEMSFTEKAISHFGGKMLPADAEKSLFDQLKMRPVYCRSGLNPPDCVPEEIVPKVAAAKSAVRTSAPVTSSAEPIDYVPGYAQIVAEQLSSDDHPECAVVIGEIMSVADSSGAPEIRAREIDYIVGRAPGICFE